MPGFKKHCGSDFNGRADWATHFSVTTKGIDKPVFQMIRIAGYITTNGVHVACKELESVDPRIRNGVDYILFQLLEQKRVTTIFIG